MLEFLICSMLTILPDYLFRRYWQGKRIGHEITFFSVWYELRWGITSCLVLTLSLITLVFYYHPSTTNVRSFFRTVTIIPEGSGRVSEIYVGNFQPVKMGDPLFRLDDSSQQAAVNTAKSQVVEVEAALIVAQAELAAALGQVGQAQGAYDLVEDNYRRQKELLDRGSAAAREAEVERLGNQLSSRQGELESAQANLKAVEEKIRVLLPAQKDSASAALAEAEAKLAKTLVVAGIDGTVEQFTLEVGDIVNPLLRPAGILVPSKSGRERFQAGFGQVAAQVIKPGMLVELGCQSKPFAIVPMVIIAVQDVIPSGQLRPSDRLIDLQDNPRPGTVMVGMEPLYPGGTDDLLPGSTCIANAYTSNADRLAEEDLGTGEWLFLHVIDTVGLVHAIVLRLQVLVLPIQQLVFSGH
jgi:multidrug resistance efflux pump